MKNITIQVNEFNMPWVEGHSSKSAFSFGDVKIWLKNLFIRFASIEQDTDTHSMLLDGLCALILDELLASENPQHDMVHECVLSLVNHLYWCNISIVNNVADCLVTIAQIYREELDPEGVNMNKRPRYND